MKLTSLIPRRYNLRILLAAVSVIAIVSAFTTKATNTLNRIAGDHERLRSVDTEGNVLGLHSMK